MLLLYTLCWECVFWQKEIEEMLGMTCGYFEEYSIEKKDDNELWSGEDVL